MIFPPLPPPNSQLKLSRKRLAPRVSLDTSPKKKKRSGPFLDSSDEDSDYTAVGTNIQSLKLYEGAVSANKGISSGRKVKIGDVNVLGEDSNAGHFWGASKDVGKKTLDDRRTQEKSSSAPKALKNNTSRRNEAATHATSPRGDVYGLAGEDAIYISDDEEVEFVNMIKKNPKSAMMVKSRSLDLDESVVKHDKMNQRSIVPCEVTGQPQPRKVEIDETGTTVIRPVQSEPPTIATADAKAPTRPSKVPKKPMTRQAMPFKSTSTLPSKSVPSISQGFRNVKNLLESIRIDGQDARQKKKTHTPKNAQTQMQMRSKNEMENQAQVWMQTKTTTQTRDRNRRYTAPRAKAQELHKIQGECGRADGPACSQESAASGGVVDSSDRSNTTAYKSPALQTPDFGKGGMTAIKNGIGELQRTITGPFQLNQALQSRRLEGENKRRNEPPCEEPAQSYVIRETLGGASLYAESAREPKPSPPKVQAKNAAVTESGAPRAKTSQTCFGNENSKQVSANAKQTPATHWNLQDLRVKKSAAPDAVLLSAENVRPEIVNKTTASTVSQTKSALRPPRDPRNHAVKINDLARSVKWQIPPVQQAYTLETTQHVDHTINKNTNEISTHAKLASRAFGDAPSSAMRKNEQAKTAKWANTLAQHAPAPENTQHVDYGTRESRNELPIQDETALPEQVCGLRCPPEGKIAPVRFVKQSISPAQRDPEAETTQRMGEADSLKDASKSDDINVAQFLARKLDSSNEVAVDRPPPAKANHGGRSTKKQDVIESLATEQDLLRVQDRSAPFLLQATQKPHVIVDVISKAPAAVHETCDTPIPTAQAHRQEHKSTPTELTPIVKPSLIINYHKDNQRAVPPPISARSLLKKQDVDPQSPMEDLLMISLTTEESVESFSDNKSSSDDCSSSLCSSDSQKLASQLQGSTSISKQMGIKARDIVRRSSWNRRKSTQEEDIEDAAEVIAGSATENTGQKSVITSAQAIKVSARIKKNPQQTSAPPLALPVQRPTPSQRLPPSLKDSSTQTTHAALTTPIVPLLSPRAEPYFEYTIHTAVWSSPTPEPPSTPPSAAHSPLYTSPNPANTHATNLFHTTRVQYTTHCAAVFTVWSSETDAHGCVTMLGAYHPLGYPGRKSYLKVWVRRDEVSVWAGMAVEDIMGAGEAAKRGGNRVEEGGGMLARGVYALRLFRLLHVDGDDNTTRNTSSATVRDQVLRIHVPHTHAELHTSLEAANRAAKALQVELSHEKDPKREIVQKWQERELRVLNQKVRDLGTVEEDGKGESEEMGWNKNEEEWRGKKREKAGRGDGEVEKGCWRSEFNASGLGGERLEILVERVWLSGPRNL